MKSCDYLYSYFILLSKKCRKKNQDHDDPELGYNADGGETGGQKKSFFKRKGAIRKKKAKDKYAAKSKDHVAETPEKADDNTTPPTPGTTSGSPQTDEVHFVDETIKPEAFTDCKSPMSEPSAPNETPMSTPVDHFSGTSLESEPLDSWKCNQHVGQNDKPTSASTSAHNSDDNEIAMETTPMPVLVPEEPVVPNMQANSVASTSTASEQSGLLKDSGGSVKCNNETTNASNSSTESCKTPVAPLNEVIITMEDDVETKLVLVPSSECSSAELLSSSGSGSVSKAALDDDGNTMERKNEDKSLLSSEYESSSGEIIYSSEAQAVKMDYKADSDDGSHVESSPAAPPLPPPKPPSPTKASTGVKREKRGKRPAYDICQLEHLYTRPQMFK